MNIKSFFVDALASALDLGLATCDDVVRHVTPDILSTHLPRPLWARLLTACVGAPKVDAQLVVETIGVANLCEHMPETVIWGCLEEIGVRAIGGTYVAKPVVVAAPPPILTRSSVSESGPTRVPLAMAPPPEKITPPPPTTATQPSPTVPVAPVPEIPNLAAELFTEDERPSAAGRSRTPTQQRFRQSGTGIGRLAASSRRPQASASPPPPPGPGSRRAPSASEYDVVTDAGNNAADDWKASLAVEDDQLVDWAGSEETVSGSPEVSDERRKR